MGSYTCLTYHIVFATKYRKPTINGNIQKRLYEYIGGTVRAKQGHVIEIGGGKDHLHILAGLSPSIAVSDVIRGVKASSSKWLREESGMSHFKWQKGFGAFTVSYDRIEIATKYIKNQEAHHKTKTFQEEYIEFLERHDIEYEFKYLFEDEHTG